MNEERQTVSGADLAASTALLAGAVGSVGFTLYAGLRVGAPDVLLVLFGGWVAFPFLVLGVAYMASRRRSVLTRLALYRSALIVSLGSLVLYAIAALGPARPRTGVFVLVAPASLLAVGLAVTMAVFFDRKRP